MRTRLSEGILEIGVVGVALGAGWMIYSQISQESEHFNEERRNQIWAQRDAEYRITSSNDPATIQRWIRKEYPYPIPEHIVENLARSGRTTALRVFLENGYAPDGRYKDGAPLVSAVSAGRYECAKLLLEHGADPNKGRGRTALHYAVMLPNSKSMWELLLEHKADPNQLSTDLRRDGPLPKVQTTSEPPGSNGGQMFVSGDAAEAKLIEVRATPLYFAAERGHWPAVLALIQHGGDPDVKASNGLSARDVARKNKDKFVLAALEDRIIG